jgi:Bacterial Ig-like domain
MRRIALLVCGLALAALPASANAAVTPDRTAGDLATAMSSSAGVAGADFTALPPNGNPAGVANSPFSDFPQAGTSFAILSSGDAVHVDPAATADAGENGGTDPGGPRAGVNDLNTLHVNLAVPESANCALVSFRFLTDEEPGADFNDGFIAELDTDDWSIVPAAGTDPSRIEAPNNFAFDANGDVISVNSPGSASLTPEGATNTGLANGTARLTAATPVTPGAHSLYLSVFDYGDDVVDSAVLLDDLHLENRAAGDCTAGVVPDDTTAPAVRITSPFDHGATDDTAPVISGTAGNAPGDSFEVRVALRSGATVLQNLTAERAGTAWSVQAGTLAPGDYTLVASQSDDAGNAGTSPAITFTVNAPPPPDDDTAPPVAPPQPEQGKSVVAGKVSGTIRIRLKNGKFRTLGANESIPLGSTIDATKGRVRITSAAGGGKTQTADFYKGQFKITQTKGKKPITQLELNGTLSCGGKASAAAGKRKKVRSLWGDGKGRFRTKGRRAAATVRGTKWFTQDTCTSTKITVKRGVVQVRDFVKRKNVTVKKGHSYVARKKRK